MTLDLYATPEEVMRAVESLREFAAENGIPERPLFGLALALEECGSNIVNHALRGDSTKRFQVRLERSGNVVTIELRDHGPRFDPTQVVERPVAAHDDDRPAGGWGIQLVRRYVDEVRYTREADENVLRLTKNLGSRPIES